MPIIGMLTRFFIWVFLFHIKEAFLFLTYQLLNSYCLGQDFTKSFVWSLRNWSWCSTLLFQQVFFQWNIDHWSILKNEQHAYQHLTSIETDLGLPYHIMNFCHAYTETQHQSTKFLQVSDIYGKGLCFRETSVSKMIT